MFKIIIKAKVDQSIHAYISKLLKMAETDGSDGLNVSNFLKSIQNCPSLKGYIY